MSDATVDPLRILFIDDNPDIRLLAQRAIRDEFPSLDAVDVIDEEAFASALRSGDFDLVITDYRLDWTDGLAILRAVKQAWPDRPVIMYTGTGSEEVAVEAIRSGLDDYVLKGPHRLARLVSAVRIALTRADERRALTESQVRYRELFETAPAGLFRLTADGIVAEANRALADTLGLRDPAQLIGKAWREFWLEAAEWDRCQAAIQQAGSVHGFEGYVRRPDGSSRSVIIHAQAATGPEGGIAWIDGSALDVTERRRAEDALRASEARKGAMLEAAIDAVIAIGEHGEITEFSPAAERMFGYRRDEVIGRELAEVVVPPDLRPRHRRGLSRYLRTGRSTILGRRIELRAMRASGQEFPVEIAIDRIAVPGPPAFIGYVRDISERRRLEANALQSQRLEAIGQLAGGVAHDFNNMLTVIGGSAELLIDELGPADPRRELVDTIEQAAARAKALTRQLLAFSRRQVLRPEPVDLGELVIELEPLVRRLVPEDIVTDVRVSPETIVAEIDPGQFEQVLLNVVVNARDAMETGGTLTIETGVTEIDEAYAAARPGVVPGRHAMVAVSDTGVGMTPEVQSRIFEPFFTTKDTGKGTGLGLAMAYGTVKQSGGDISVYSEPEHGTTFRIHLPLSTAQPASAELPAERRGDAWLPGTTVLIVEDEDEVRDLMVRAVTAVGATVFTAANGTDALTAVDKSIPLDIVVTDVVLPGHNGPEVVRLLRESRPGVKVLFISGYAPQFALSRGLVLETEANFLQKPFTLDQFIDAVREALDSGAVPAERAGRPA
jgi:two-component system cell cycle sensor histidine kinase/response regulator CckA